MKAKSSMALAGAFLLAAACASPTYDSAREWQRAECNKVIDSEARDRCLRRVEGDYGRRSSDPAPPPPR
jgi:hypothetical protein